MHNSMIREKKVRYKPKYALMILFSCMQSIQLAIMILYIHCYCWPGALTCSYDIL